MTDPIPPLIRRYLASYVRRRRLIALCGAIGWAAALAGGVAAGLANLNRLPRSSPRVQLSIESLAGAISIAIIAYPLFRLFRRPNCVAAAIEIEHRLPEFDQRLITVASQPIGSQLLDQICAEVESIARARRARVSLRPLLGPMLAIVAAGLLLFATHWAF